MLSSFRTRSGTRKQLQAATTWSLRSCIYATNGLRTSSFRGLRTMYYHNQPLSPHTTSLTLPLIASRLRAISRALHGGMTSAPPPGAIFRALRPYGQSSARFPPSRSRFIEFWKRGRRQQRAKPNSPHLWRLPTRGAERAEDPRGTSTAIP
jgi:hypothetical protein